MFVTFTLTALLASASVLLVRADAVPTTPGPGIIYKQGETCHIEWSGDEVSPTAWKNMAIELMTGSNFGMVHLTTVATGLDGTVTGTFDHPCPAVIPNSAIYFYQFSSAGSPNKTWTTRFAIASPTGATTDPTNPTQPTTNAPIPWGTGSLADPSTAVPAPNFAISSSAPPLSNGASSSSAPAPVDPNTSSSSVTTSRFTTVTTSSSASPTSSATTNSTSSTVPKDSAAVSVVVDGRVWQAAVALGASAVAFAVLL